MMFFICHKFITSAIVESIENYVMNNPEKIFDLRVFKNYVFGQICKDHIKDVEEFFNTLDIPEEEIVIEQWD